MNGLAVAGTAFGASLLGSLSGGSSSRITTPAWIALGAPFATPSPPTRWWDRSGLHYAMAAAWCAFAAAVYFANGAVDPALRLPATAGALAGGAAGSRIGREKGAPLVRPLFIGAGLVLTARLILGA